MVIKDTIWEAEKMADEKSPLKMATEAVSMAVVGGALFVMLSLLGEIGEVLRSWRRWRVCGWRR